MRAAVVIVAATLLAIASARCPNSCSGHGDCGGSDLCTCWPNWQGYDCSERTCEFDVAWAVDHRQNPHYYAECSGKGVCDRSTGLCACFDGYTGSACRRSACPNDCSGHGKCRLVAELDNANKAKSTPYAVSGTATVGSLHQYTEWDGDKIQACVCDGGFFGPDCSQRYCPMGDDPLTICSETVLSGSGSTQNTQKQKISLTSSYPTAAAGAQATITNFVGELVLHFTDSYGEVWTTGRIGNAASANLFAAAGATTTATAIKNALKAIPNFRIPSVSVADRVDPALASAGGVDTISTEWEVTFDNERNAGNQNLLACDALPLGCQSAGCSPKYQQPKTWPVSVQTNAYPSATYSAGAAPAYTLLYANADFIANHIVTAYGETTDDATPISSTNLAYTPPTAGSSILRTLIPAYWQQSADGGFLDNDYANQLITADSIFDNSGLTYDQATVQISVYKQTYTDPGLKNWGYRDEDTYAVYAVTWDYTLTGASAIDTSCDDLDATCEFHFVPTGLYYAGGASDESTASGAPASETGVGYNHVPIGNGLYVNLATPVAHLTDATKNQALYIRFDVGTVRCAVTETQRADVDYENLECSGRGSCDHSTGTCTCFEGHYGDHCSLQTILV